uniref:Polyprotein allergen nematode domain-containing protein n=1 Tax=Plectus sambesii TaxID=2011161 RepID=A0A914W7Z3_9BILA
MMWTFILLTLGALVTTASSSESSNGGGEGSIDRAIQSWQELYFTWLTDAQKSELDELVGSVDSQDEITKIKVMLKKTQEFYNSIDEERAVKATNDMQMFCKSQMTSFFGPEEMEELKNLKEAEAPKEQLFAKFNEFVAELADTDDRIQVRLYAAFCKVIFKLN